MSTPFSSARRAFETVRKILEPVLGRALEGWPVFDTGDVGLLRAQLAEILAQHPEGAGPRPVLVGVGSRGCLHPAAFGQAAAAVPERLLVEIIRAEWTRSVSKTPDVSGLLRATYDVDDGEAFRRSHHGMAIERLWAGELESGNGQDTCVPIELVLIDDDPVFRNAFQQRISDKGFHVLVYHDLDAYEEAVKKRSALPPEAVDLFLIDIVVEKNGTPTAVGIERDVRQILLNRDLRDFPQVFMVSVLPAEAIAHVAIEVGASYYLEKHRLLAHPEPARLLARLLWHVTAGLGDESLRLALKTPQGDGWDGLSTDFHKTAWCLLSRSVPLEKLNLLQRLEGGLTGAATLLVQPIVRDDDGVRRLLPRVVKINDAQAMAKEWRAYHKYVSPQLSRGFARIDSAYYRSGETAAISYTLAGSEAAFAAGQLCSCEELFQNEHPLAQQIPRLLFDGVLAPLHQSSLRRGSYSDLLDSIGAELQPIPLSGSNLLPWIPGTGEDECPLVVTRVDRRNQPSPRIRLRRDQIGKRFPEYTLTVPEEMAGSAFAKRVRPGMRFVAPREITGGDLSFIPPDHAVAGLVSEARSPSSAGIKKLIWPAAILARLQDMKSCIQSSEDKNSSLLSVMAATDLLKLYLPRLREGTQPELEWGVVHGDLNLKNVMASLDAGDLWLIDFANTRPGPPALDFALFEIEIRLKILSPLFGGLLPPRKADARVWCALARALTKSFEVETQLNDRVATAMLLAAAQRTKGRRGSFREDFARVEPMIRTGWQMIHQVRRSAFSTYYRGDEGHKAYALVYGLLCLRVIQRYRSEVLRPDCGPLGLQWALDGFRVALSLCKRHGGFG